MERILAILEDLRAGGGDAAGGGTAGSDLTLREMAVQMLDILTLVAQGITLDFAAAARSDQPPRADYCRLLIALSKLLHNALIPSRAHSVSFNTFISKTGGSDCQVSWQVADDGIGIAPERRDEL